MKKEYIRRSVKNVFKLIIGNLFSLLLLSVLWYLADGDFILYLALQYCQLLMTLQTKPPAVSESGRMSDFCCTCPFFRCEEEMTRGDCVT